MKSATTSPLNGASAFMGLSASIGQHSAIRALQPAYSGIMTKIASPNELDSDFMIQGPAVHGFPGLVNLFGIESPGLTSCLSIGEAVCKSLGLPS